MTPSSTTRRSVARRPSRTVLGAVSAGAALVLLTGCGAGQIGTTGSQVAAVNGAQGAAGDLAVRDVSLRFPSGEEGFYAAGEDAPLLFTIANGGLTADELVSVTSPAAGEITLEGTTDIPGQTSLVSAAEEESVSEGTSVVPTTPGETTAAPSTSAGNTNPTRTSVPNPAGGDGEPGNQVGVVTAELTDLTQDVRPGLTVPVTFTFARAGAITVPVPIGAPDEARE